MELTEGKAWLRSAEVGHDFTQHDAVETVRAVSHSAMAGMRLGDHDSYRSGKVVGGVPVAHWRSAKSREVVKVYPKTIDLVRVEVGCTNRVGMASLCDARKTAALSGKPVAELLYAFYECACPIAAAAVAHAMAVAGRAGSISDLIDALEPLRRIIRRERSGSGYTPTAAAARAARDLYEALLNDGLCRAKGHRQGTRIRDVLDELAAPGGPLAHGAQGGIYCLRPEFGRAAATLSKSCSRPSTGNAQSNIA